jgi:hypothetical protein
MAISITKNEKKDLTIALLKNKYFEAYVKSFTINKDVNELMEVQMTFVITDENNFMSDFASNFPAKVAIVKI